MGKECYELGVHKNKDYGSDNILRFGTMGIIVRIGDKINRLNNLQKSGTASVTDEKMLYTIMDVFNYAVYGIMLSNNVWF
ncbi:MAG: nucleotide modification associated domain-containing protein [Candidatus Micrarchaeia archaeon]